MPLAACDSMRTVPCCAIASYCCSLHHSPTTVFLAAEPVAPAPQSSLLPHFSIHTSVSQFHTHAIVNALMFLRSGAVVTYVKKCQYVDQCHMHRCVRGRYCGSM